MTKSNRSVERSMEILEVVSEIGVCSLAFLAAQTGLPKPTVLRICGTLVARRWLSQSRNDKRYRMGPRFPRMQAAPVLIDALVESGSSPIVELSNTTGLGVDLAASIGDGRLEIVDTTRQFSLHGIFPDCIGYRPSPFRSALGCVFLASLNEETRNRCTTRLMATLTGSDRTAALEYPAKVDSIRKTGFAAREKGYWGRAVDYGGVPTAISVAIRSGAETVGAVSLVWLAEQYETDRVVAAHLDRLRSTAEIIGRQLAAEHPNLLLPSL
ncbi:IclR family transcriptional regulator [Neptunicoccus sediminis]|uniref:IclR family transcriptional regulator n=1 Tax=Neptunicoccus sediminis TaxID=1892596 RepID=UPI00084622B9|nr:helix-turn-helix domain-containing protein [Neptunicoccus sediminis]